MSKFHMETVKCPKCHSHFQFKVWDSVNVDLNREEKEKILDGTFYDTDCPFCHTRIHGIYGFLYHDMKHEYLVSVYHDFTEAICERFRIYAYWQKKSKFLILTLMIL